MKEDTSNRLRRKVSLAAVAFLAGLNLHAAENKSVVENSKTSSPWFVGASLAFKETLDENVFLQNVTSNAFRHSFISTLVPSMSIGYTRGAEFQGTLSYAPELAFFHGQPGEDFNAHRVQLTLDGTASATKWELNENFLAIDGSEVGPSFYGPGGAPAAGAPQIRDRHAAMVERGQVRVTQTLDTWFLRPVVSGYYHDFQTLQRLTPGYQNYVDRSDWNAGADLGRDAFGNTKISLGYRYGQQTQARLLSFPEQYASAYHRLLLGIEGQLATWLGVSISVGPELRHYDNSVAAGFGERDEVIPFVDSTVTLNTGAMDTVSVSCKIFEQPGFSGRSTYLDRTFETIWRHKCNQHLTVGTGLRAYNTDFLKPTMRNDWILTPNVVVSYALNTHASTEASWLLDDAFSLVPNTQGREYTRNAVTLGIKYVF